MSVGTYSATTKNPIGMAFLSQERFSRSNSPISYRTLLHIPSSWASHPPPRDILTVRNAGGKRNYYPIYRDSNTHVQMSHGCRIFDSQTVTFNVTSAIARAHQN